jgi:hypothetical protein
MVFLADIGFRYKGPQHNETEYCPSKSYKYNWSTKFPLVSLALQMNFGGQNSCSLYVSNDNEIYVEDRISALLLFVLFKGMLKDKFPAFHILAFKLKLREQNTCLIYLGPPNEIRSTKFLLFICRPSE